MEIEYEFDKIALLRHERRELRRIRRRGSAACTSEDTEWLLLNAGLIEHEVSEDRDKFNAQIKLGTVHVTDKYLRYRMWLQNRILCNIILPILISTATTLLVSLLQGLFRTISG